VRISAKGNRVIWDTWQGDTGNPRAGTLVFARDQYAQAVRDAIEDHSWETPDRTVARILGSLVDHRALTSNNLKYQWASGRIRDSTLTISLALLPANDQVLVHVPWAEQSPDEVAHEAAELLKTDPNKWPDIVWYGKNSKPPFDGPAWRNWS
jgi:hypothetical protein